MFEAFIVENVEAIVLILMVLGGAAVIAAIVHDHGGMQ